MAYNDDDQFSSRGNPFGGLLKTAIGLSPIFGAGVLMAGKIRSNQAVNPAMPLGIGQGGSGAVPAIGRGLGSELGKGIRDSRQADLRRINDLTNQILKGDGVQKMFSAVSEQNALVQSLLDVMGDPTSGLDQNSLLGYKEKLMGLARDNTDPDEMKRIIQTVVKAVDEQSSEHAKVRWERNLREYQKLGPTLAPPGKPMDAGASFTSMEASNLQGAARKRHRALLEHLGSSGHGVDVVSTQWGGRQQVYARVYSQGAGKSSYLATLPLDIGGGASRVTPVFSNEGLTTAYAAPKHFIDAQKAQQLMAGGKAGSLDDVIKGAGIGVEDYFIKEFGARVRGGRRLGSTGARGYREWQRQYMTVMPRMMYSQPDSAMSKHLGQVVASGQNYATVVNFGRGARGAEANFMADLGTMAGFDAFAPGYQTTVRGLEGETIGRIGLARGSALSSIKSIGKASRSYFPVESRIEQLYGRESMFVAKTARTMGRGGVLTSGATAVMQGGAPTMVGRNIDWANNLTGATNKAVLLDVVGGVYNELEGSGVAVGRGRDTVQHTFTKPILDPGTQGNMGSKLFMDEIFGKAKPGESVRLTRDQIRKHGGFLGFGPNGLQYLREDPRMMDMQVSYNVTESGGKKHINLMGTVRRRMETWKGFSTLHKGNIQATTGSNYYKLASQMGFSRDQMRALGLSSDNTLIAAGDMLKKGAGFFDLQMRSGYALVSGDTNFDATLSNLASADRLGLGNHELGRSTGAVIQALSDRVKSGHTTAKEAGHVLAAVYSRGHGGTMSIGGKRVKGWIKDVDAPQGIDPKRLKKAMFQAFGKEHYADVVSAARTGAAIGAASFTQGAGVGDYGLGRGSVEPRFAYMMQQRLKRMGFGVDEASSILASIYKNKLGGSAGLKAAGGLTKMAESLVGTSGMLEGARELMTGVPSYNLSDLAQLASKDFNDLMASHEKGFILDLTSGADSVATRAMASGAGDTFRQGRIFVPGRDVVESMRDTFIKTATGDNQVIHGEYSRMMGDFLGDMNAMTSQTATAQSRATEVMGTFKKRALDLAARSIHGVASGKIRGMQSMVAYMYTLDSQTLFSSKEKWNLARDLMKKTHGQAAFMDSTAFLSQLNDFMGSRDNVQVLHEGAKKAERFFMSTQEALRTGNVHAAKGVLNVGTRHPELSLGNIVPLQVFQHLDDTQSQHYLGGFLASEHGGAWKGRGINNWQDVAQLGGGERLGFFRDFTRGLDKFAPEGGGALYLPKTMATIHFANNTSMKVDMGVAGAAIGDFDGDQWMMMMTNETTGRKIMSSLSAGKRDEWLRADAEYKIKSHIFAEEAKEGLKRHHGGQGIDFYSSTERVRQGILKENAAKAAVGSLDTRLNKIKIALLDMKVSGTGLSGVEEALALLKVVQEHAVIKGKKLPVYMPFAEGLTEATDHAFTTGDTGPLRSVMENQIFPGSEAWKGMSVTGVDSEFTHGRLAQKMDVNLGNTMGLIDQAIQQARITGVADMPTANWITMAMNSDNPEKAARARNLLSAGETLQSAMISSSVGDTMTRVTAGAEATLNKVTSTLGHMDRRMLGIAASGVAASAAALAIVGHQGYAPEPMTMPGEAVSPDVRAAMGAGNLFSGVPNEQYMPRTDAYATAGRPVNMPTTYVNSTNSYQMSGRVNSMRQLSKVNDYLGSISSGPVGGSIRINDARQPITSNYMDRLTGEY